MKSPQNWSQQIVHIARSMQQQLRYLQDCGYTFLPRMQLGNQQTKQEQIMSQTKQITTTDSSVHNSSSTPAAQPADHETSQHSATNTAQAQLDQLQRQEIGDCMRCKLCSHRTHIVFGVGNPQAKLVFVGEAPGAAEDAQGEPFVGRAGQLLTRMIEAMGFKRQDVYICNVIKCRPPDNRDPEPDEVKACEPFLKQQLSILQPKVIVALGRYACQCLLRANQTMSKLRGTWSSYEGVCLMPTFHPAYLLRSPSKKREAWEDLRQVLQKLQEA